LRSLVVFHSFHHGNTEKVANAIARALRCEAVRADGGRAGDLRDFDLVGFGSGIYGARHHAALLKAVDGAEGLDGKRVFVFSTSGGPSFLTRAFQHNALRAALGRRKARIVSEFTARGFADGGALGALGGLNRGRPDARDLERADLFARETEARAVVLGQEYSI
jgi:flavodoxin